MKKIFFIIAGLLLSNLLNAQTTDWTAGSGNWSVGGNWSAGAPLATNSNDITIDCSCTVTYDLAGDLVLNGSMEIGAGSTLDMNGKKLTVGPANNIAYLSNDGTITNSGKIEVKGDGTNIGFGQGPWIFTSGTINASDMHVGHNSGGGVLTNLS